MTRSRLILCLFGSAILCGGIFLLVSDCTIVPMVARGSGPNGVQITTGGWAAFFLSLLGTCGFSLSGLLVWVAGHLVPASSHTTKAISAPLSPLPELAQSFASLMEDKSNRAAQRRFVFALVDAASLLQGCQTSHDNGVIVIRYGGYADPVSPGASESTALQSNK